MVLCVIALPLFAILGIFSASYRQLAKEAVECVFKKVTFQPCNTGLDTRIKTSVVGPIFRRSEWLGKQIYRHFELLSWIFVILSVASVLGVAYGGYNYYLYGNCNGPDSTSFCIFDPTGANQQVSGSSIGECATGVHDPTNLQFSWFNASLHAKLAGSTGKDAKEMWFIGCYNCKYTREVWPMILELQKEYNFTLVFAHLPLHEEDKFTSRVGYCIRQQSGANESGSSLFWKFVGDMFDAPINSSRNESFVMADVAKLGLDVAAINSCVASNVTNDAIIDQIQNIAAVGVYGTPTIYSDGTILVGPKPKRVYERLVN